MAGITHTRRVRLISSPGSVLASPSHSHFWDLREDRPLLRIPTSFAQLQALNALLKKYRDIYPYRIIICYVTTYLLYVFHRMLICFIPERVCSLVSKHSPFQGLCTFPFLVGPCGVFPALYPWPVPALRLAQRFATASVQRSVLPCLRYPNGRPGLTYGRPN